MGHHHHHSHAEHTHQINRAFVVAATLNFGFTLIEAIYAILAHSMSLLADAGHNLSDVLGLLFAWGANWLLTKSASERYSYGFKKTTILAALANALLLILATGMIAYESIIRLFDPSPITENIVIIVAFIGIFINGGTALLFIKDSKHDLNIRSAFLHLAGDALISIGVVITGIAIYFTHWHWLDPLVGLLIVIIILIGTWHLVRDSVNSILDAVPRHIEQSAVFSYLEKIPGVKEVHDLHIWGLSTREVALTTHLVMPEIILQDQDYYQINTDLKTKFNIDHVTIQIERGILKNPCGQMDSCG